jgi:hypothetical protein
MDADGEDPRTVPLLELARRLRQAYLDREIAYAARNDANDAARLTYERFEQSGLAVDKAIGDLMTSIRPPGMSRGLD